MEEAREKLRADFYAHTDITVSIAPESWQKYAEFLEEISCEKINEELLRRNAKLSDDIEKVINILENSISSR